MAFHATLTFDPIIHLPSPLRNIQRVTTTPINGIVIAMYAANKSGPGKNWN